MFYVSVFNTSLHYNRFDGPADRRTNACWICGWVHKYDIRAKQMDVTTNRKLTRAYRDGDTYLILDDSPSVRTMLSRWAKEYEVNYRTFSIYGGLFIIFCENFVEWANNQ